MPYIKKELRNQVDERIDNLKKVIQECGKENRAGVMNYVISKLVNSLYGLRYSEINEVVGMLDCTKMEYYRRVASPYEDKKIIESGDVYTY